MGKGSVKRKRAAYGNDADVTDANDTVSLEDKILSLAELYFSDDKLLYDRSTNFAPARQQHGPNQGFIPIEALASRKRLRGLCSELDYPVPCPCRITARERCECRLKRLGQPCRKLTSWNVEDSQCGVLNPFHHRAG